MGFDELKEARAKRAEKAVKEAKDKAKRVRKEKALLEEGGGGPSIEVTRGPERKAIPVTKEPKAKVARVVRQSEAQDDGTESASVWRAPEARIW